MRKVIVNSTPIIALCHAGLLNLLHILYNEIIIPEAVYKEVLAKPDSICKSMVDEAILAEWMHVRSVQNTLAKSLYKLQLHDGEVEVMILAKELQADLVIIDDLNARKHAHYLDLPLTGTLGVLIKSKQLGYIDSLRSVFEQLQRRHIYISHKLIAYSLQLVGESDV